MKPASSEPPASASRRDFGRRHRLRRSSDFSRCYRRGGKRHGALTSLHFLPNDETTARLGVTASRKVGNAVIRHRVKRRIREIFRCWEGRATVSGLDVVVHVKPAAARAEFTALKEELETLLRQVAARGSV